MYEFGSRANVIFLAAMGIAVSPLGASRMGMGLVWLGEAQASRLDCLAFLGVVSTISPISAEMAADAK